MPDQIKQNKPVLKNGLVTRRYGTAHMERHVVLPDDARKIEDIAFYKGYKIAGVAFPETLRGAGIPRLHPPKIPGDTVQSGIYRTVDHQ